MGYESVVAMGVRDELGLLRLGRACSVVWLVEQQVGSEAKWKLANGCDALL